MTLIPEVHDALARAVATRAPRRRWWHPSRRAGLLAAGALIATGSAFAATGGWRPVLGSQDRAPRPLAAPSGVPADQLAALAVLRRPQTDADRGPLVRRALRVLSRVEINGIHTDAIRVVFQSRREVVVLVPVQRAGSHSTGYPSSIRRDVLCLMSSSYQRARTIVIPARGERKRRTWHLRAGFNGWGMNCGGLDMLRGTGIQALTSPDGNGLVVDGHPERTVRRAVALVPDGVARVRVRLRQSRRLMVTVQDNVYRYTVHGFPASMGTLWFDSAGRRIDHHGAKRAGRARR